MCHSGTDALESERKEVTAEWNYTFVYDSTDGVVGSQATWRRVAGA